MDELKVTTQDTSQLPLVGSHVRCPLEPAQLIVTEVELQSIIIIIIIIIIINIIIIEP
jgi:hypothetical protein